MPRPLLSIVTVQASLALALAILATARAEEPQARRYSDGPLKLDDFQLAPPDPLPIGLGGQVHATTFTELRYKYHYDFQLMNNRFRVKATGVDCNAVVVPSKSWIVKSQKPALMAHEQGHFDITEIFARRARDKFAKQIADGNYKGEGATEIEARDAMLKLVKADFDLEVADMLAEQKKYDDQTMQSANREAQGQWGRLIAERLAEGAGARDEPAKKEPAKKTPPKKPKAK